MGIHAVWSWHSLSVDIYSSSIYRFLKQTTKAKSACTNVQADLGLHCPHCIRVVLLCHASFVRMSVLLLCFFLISYIFMTRAGVCKTLCPQLPDSNTVWLQYCLAMMVTTVQIYDFNVILSKGNNSKIGDDWDKKKIRITYFFMRNQNMKFQNISIHGSKLMLYTIKQRH